MASTLRPGVSTEINVAVSAEGFAPASQIPMHVKEKIWKYLCDVTVSRCTHMLECIPVHMVGGICLWPRSKPATENQAGGADPLLEQILGWTFPPG